ncbi:MAG: DNA-binding protein WhiA [Tissierellia bacterium]|nr:DNA-binding protein WhiA [Tissierellia bacterium]
MKNECATVANENYILEELTAIFRVNGTVHYHKDHLETKFITEHNPLVRRIYTFFRKRYDYSPKILIKSNNISRKKTCFTIVINDKISKQWAREGEMAISILGIEPNIGKNLVDTVDKRKAYIRGTFLGAGSVSNPEKRYHLEIVSNSQKYLQNFNKIVMKHQIDGKIIGRNDHFIWYLKDADKISDFLSLIDAYHGVLLFEDTRAMKDIKNNVNRRNNCELANMDKMLEASFRQKTAIEKIDKNIGLENIDPSLQEIANLRILYPDISLKELGERCNPPLSKSGTNYRIKKLIDISKNLEQ